MTHDERVALAALHKACAEGADDEWILGFVRQYPFVSASTPVDPMDLQPEPHPPHRCCDCAGCVAYWEPILHVPV